MNAWLVAPHNLLRVKVQSEIHCPVPGFDILFCHSHPLPHTAARFSDNLVDVA